MPAPRRQPVSTVETLNIPANQVLPGDRYRETDDDDFVLVDRTAAGQSWIGEALADAVTLYFDGGYLQVMATQEVQVERTVIVPSEATE